MEGVREIASNVRGVAGHAVHLQINSQAVRLQARPSQVGVQAVIMFSRKQVVFGDYFLKTIVQNQCISVM